ncbi:Fcf1-domain-containing protein [Leucogyrophana mollusca]|uniref:Fcf1-domain-containing protein n=1 Tax=Leucogyrophana mollusca TaxID=85980 RepID=A0ACB8BHM0_9AGAM|nr:Fcf1-domain-containing protein [Leucogyrophana mollusca]
MRQKRAKAYRKLMALYCMSFNFREPYQVLVDSETCKIAIDSKMELGKQLGAVLQGTIKPMITQCCMEELYRQGKALQPAVDLAKSFERRKCNHREPIPGDQCLASVVGDANKHRYVIATQSQPLRTRLRTIPAVPIVHINRSVMILEPPSDVTLKAKESAEESALHPGAPDSALILSNSAEPTKRKKKGPKGPNPLSMKKKKVAPPEPSTTTGQAKTAKVTRTADESPTGSKRKRDSASDDGHDWQADPRPDEAGEDVVRTGKKRKRRRKTTSTVATPLS